MNELKVPLGENSKLFGNTIGPTMNELKVPLGENSKLFIWQYKLLLWICLIGSLHGSRTDNQNVPSIINKGSRVPEFRTLALKLFQICLQYRMKWVPREANHVADTIRKIVDFEDYTINDQVFAELDIKWGPHTVDVVLIIFRRFTCSTNKTLSI